MDTMKPKVVMVVDQPNWAFAISARDMVKFMPQYDFDIVTYYDSPNDQEHYKDADLVYLFGHYMYSWMPSDFDFSKSCTGIRALCGYVDDMSSEDHTQDPRTAPGAQHILKFPLVHAVSLEAYELFKGFHPDVHHVCHGVDTEFYSQKQNYMTRKPLVLGWAGNRSNSVKGIELVIEQFKTRSNIVLKMAEYGENQLDREQLRDFYHSLDAFVLPSKSEGVSAAMLEAMSCGLPIIATNTGGWKELKDFGGGITMTRTVNSLNEAMDRLLSLSDDELKTMGSINRREMVNNWDWKIKAKDFDRFFKYALHGK